MKIYLASASPRRKELLKQVGLSFKTMPSTEEQKITKTEPAEVVEELSYQKAVDVCGKLVKEGKEDFVVIGADTVVACWGDTGVEIQRYVPYVCHLQRGYGCNDVFHVTGRYQTICRQRGTDG